MMSWMVKHIQVFSVDLVHLLELFFVFYCNYKNLQYIKKNIWKYFNVPLTVIQQLGLFFDDIINLNNFEKHFKSSIILVHGCVKLIQLPDPVSKQLDEYQFFKKSNAYKYTAWTDRESHLAFNMLMSNEKLNSIYKPGQIRILTEPVLDIYMKTFSNYSRDVVKQGLLNNIFFCDADDMKKFDQLQYLLHIHIYLYILYNIYTCI